MAWPLCVRLLTSDFPDKNGLEGFTVTKAIAAAADIKVTALVMRRIEMQRLRLNQGIVVIYIEFGLIGLLMKGDDIADVIKRRQVRRGLIFV